MTSKYSMIIEWSDEDDAFIVTLPEFPNNRTHGSTYEEAARNGQEVLEMLIEMHRTDHRPLPTPRVMPSAPMLV
jgi:predicted RNase H-like HicB family nuclease